jgi:hypothetical protein
MKARKVAPKKASPKARPEAKLLENYQKARALRKKHSALEDIARAKITAKGYEIDHEYEPSMAGSKMKLRPIHGLK